MFLISVKNVKLDHNLTGYTTYLIELLLQYLNSLILLDDFCPQLTKGTTDECDHAAHYYVRTWIRTNGHMKTSKNDRDPTGQKIKIPCFLEANSWLSSSWAFFSKRDIKLFIQTIHVTE